MKTPVTPFVGQTPMSAGPVVAVVGSLLVAASPLGAGESGVRVQGIGPDQLDQESPDFRDGEGDEGVGA